MPDRNERIGSLVKRGVLLFANAVPFPSSALVAAIGAAVVSKLLDIHDRRVSEVLSEEVGLDHISYVEPDEAGLLRFYEKNPLYPQLASEFADELQKRDTSSLRRFYPYLYHALVLKRKVPALLFHREMQEGRYREMVLQYESLSHGYGQIKGNADRVEQVNHFAGELWEVIGEAYEASRSELKNRDNGILFELVDLIREAAAS